MTLQYFVEETKLLGFFLFFLLLLVGIFVSFFALSLDCVEFVVSAARLSRGRGTVLGLAIAELRVKCTIICRRSRVPQPFTRVIDLAELIVIRLELFC